MPFTEINSSGVPLLRWDRIPLRHGFARRAGGVSVPEHLASLNVGEHPDDTADAVTENRARLCRALNADPARLIFANQIHSDHVVTVTERDVGRRDLECDALVTNCPGIVLMVKTADCTPILLCDLQAGVVAAVHAGWRGTAARIVQRAVDSMTALGARQKHILAAIGPCIHSCCYEVGNDVADAVCALGLGDDLLTETGAGKYHFDMPECNRRLLLGAGLAEENIGVAPQCTCCRPDLYFSHRANGTQRGVMGAAITL